MRLPTHDHVFGAERFGTDTYSRHCDGLPRTVRGCESCRCLYPHHDRYVCRHTGGNDCSVSEAGYQYSSTLHHWFYTCHGSYYWRHHPDFQSMPQDKINIVSSLAANVILFSIIFLFIVKALRRKINVFEAFIDGAKDGFKTAVSIIPFLIAILVGIGVFRASGAMDFLMEGLCNLVALTGMDTRWVDGMPTALMKPLSGSGARGMMIDAMKAFGADSFAGRLSAVLQGATDTTFYIVAVYYGSVNIKNSRYTVPYALLADLAGVITAIFVAYLFFG